MSYSGEKVKNEDSNHALQLNRTSLLKIFSVHNLVLQTEYGCMKKSPVSVAYCALTIIPSSYTVFASILVCELSQVREALWSYGLSFLIIVQKVAGLNPHLSHLATKLSLSTLQ